MSPLAIIFSYFFLTFVLLAFVVYAGYIIYYFYTRGVRKLGLFVTKKRREIFNNVIQNIKDESINWTITCTDEEWRNITIVNFNKNMYISLERCRMGEIVINDIYKEKERVRYNDSEYITLTLIEIYRIKRARIFLEKWYKNKHENESVDSLYIKSTGFSEL